MGTGNSAAVLVLGLGNPILRDDGVGWRVAEQVGRRLTGTAALPASRDGVTVDCAALGGLALMERMIGYRRAILVDAIRTGIAEPGTVCVLGLDDLPTLNSGSVHDVSLPDALEVGRRLGVEVPLDMTVVAVEARDLLDFGETLSPSVAAAVPKAVRLVLDLVAAPRTSE